MSLAVGLDVSPRRCGWAICSLADGAPIACGCENVDLPDHDWARERMVDAIRHVAEVAERHGEVHYCSTERPALPPKSGTNGAFNAGRAYQEAISAVRRRWPWAVVDEMQPSEWRRLAGLKGNASKDEVFRQADVLRFDVWRGRGRVEQDAADAACIAVAGVRRNAETLAVPAGEAGR